MLLTTRNPMFPKLKHSIQFLKTLEGRVKGYVLHGDKSGPGFVLTSTEEDTLCKYLINTTDRSFSLTKNIVMVYSLAVAKI